MADATALLQGAAAGDLAAAEQVYGLLYAELRRVARARVRPVRDIVGADTTEVLHEAYLRLYGQPMPAFDDRQQFLAYASRTMRNVVVDLLRARQTLRRGGGVEHTQLNTLHGDSLNSESGEDEALRVHAAMDELERQAPRLAQVVELRYFAGMTSEEAGAAMGLTERTIERDWAKARLLLSRLLGG